MSGFIVQGPKSDYRDSSGLKNGLYPKFIGIRSVLLDMTPQQRAPEDDALHFKLWSLVMAKTAPKIGTYLIKHKEK